MIWYDEVCRYMKERITITLDKEILDWLDTKVASRVFANRSHGFEFLIKEMMIQENEGKNNDHSGQGTA